MAMVDSVQSQATQASCEAYMEFQLEADKDGVRTDSEKHIIGLLERSYLLNQTDDTVDQLCAQLKRRGLVEPNVPLAARIKDLIALVTRKKGPSVCADCEPEVA